MKRSAKLAAVPARSPEDLGGTSASGISAAVLIRSAAEEIRIVARAIGSQEPLTQGERWQIESRLQRIAKRIECGVEHLDAHNAIAARNTNGAAAVGE